MDKSYKDKYQVGQGQEEAVDTGFILDEMPECLANVLANVRFSDLNNFFEDNTVALHDTLRDNDGYTSESANAILNNLQLAIEAKYLEFKLANQGVDAQIKIENPAVLEFVDCECFEPGSDEAAQISDAMTNYLCNIASVEEDKLIKVCDELVGQYSVMCNLEGKKGHFDTAMADAKTRLNDELDKFAQLRNAKVAEITAIREKQAAKEAEELQVKEGKDEIKKHADGKLNLFSDVAAGLFKQVKALRHHEDENEFDLGRKF
jgi:hypothetical protein